MWLQCPCFTNSFAFFDYLLEKTGVVGTPGGGFGRNGEGYFRLTSFADETTVRGAMAAFSAAFG